jgi:hypothetical protein
LCRRWQGRAAAAVGRPRSYQRRRRSLARARAPYGACKRVTRISWLTQQGAHALLPCVPSTTAFYLLWAVAGLDVWHAPADRSCAPTPRWTVSGALIGWRWLRPPGIKTPAVPPTHQNQRPGGGPRAPHGHLQGHHRRLRAALGGRAAEMAGATTAATDLAFSTINARS